MKTIDLTGQRYGHLVVVRLAEKSEIPTGRYTKDRCAWWNTRCDCGNTIVVPSKRLRAKKSRVTGCGCTGKRKPLGEAAKTEVYNLKKANARARGKEFTLTLDEFIAIASSPCRYCGLEWSSLGPKHPRFHGGFPHNGIDRIDSTMGYVPGNCVPCCKTCNYAKSDMTVEQFRAWLRRIHLHFMS